MCVSPLHALLALQPPAGEDTDKEPATSRADGLVQAQQALIFHTCVRETCQGHGYSILNFLMEGDIQLVQLRNLWAGLSWRGRVLDAACLWLICAWALDFSWASKLSFAVQKGHCLMEVSCT